MNRQDERERIIERQLQWLRERMQQMQYGEVGFVLVLHEHTVKHVRRVDNERQEP